MPGVNCTAYKAIFITFLISSSWTLLIFKLDLLRRLLWRSICTFSFSFRISQLFLMSMVFLSFHEEEWSPNFQYAIGNNRFIKNPFVSYELRFYSTFIGWGVMFRLCTIYHICIIGEVHTDFGHIFSSWWFYLKKLFAKCFITLGYCPDVLWTACDLYLCLWAFHIR